MTTRLKDTASLEKLLEEISQKLSIVISKTDDLTFLMKETAHKSTNIEKQAEEIQKEIADLAQQMELSQPKGRSNDESIREAEPMAFHLPYEMDVEKMALSEKRRIIRTWRTNLNQRKMNFWNFYRCEKQHNIYQKWLTKETPILPKKFLIKKIDGEPKEETELRWNLTLQRFETEISLLESRKTRYEIQYKQLDAEMTKIISEIASGEVKDKMVEIWINDISLEEEKFRQIWIEKEIWMRKYGDTYGKEPTKNWTSTNIKNKNKFTSFSRPTKSTTHREQRGKSYSRNLEKTRDEITVLNERSHSFSQINSHHYGYLSHTRNATYAERVKHRNDIPKRFPQRHAAKRSYTAPKNAHHSKIHFLGTGRYKPTREKDNDETVPKTICQ